MFTLKMQRDPDTPQGGDTTWLTGVEWVELVSRHDIATWEELTDRWAGQFINYVVTLGSQPPRDAAQPERFGTPPTKMVTMLAVKSVGCEPRNWLVQRAWLLGPDGQTIDRVAP